MENRINRTACAAVVALCLTALPALAFAQTAEVGVVAVPEPYTVVELAREKKQTVVKYLQERLPAAPLVVVVARRSDAYLARASSSQQRRQIITEVASIVSQFSES